MRYTGITALVALLALNAPRYAAACGQTPPAYWTFIGAFPSQGEQVPTDGAIVLTGKSWAEVYPDRGVVELFQAAQVSVYDSTGALVAGTTDAWWGAAGPALAWRPNSLLPSHASFTVEASLNTEPFATMVRPPAATGETSLRLDFMTGGSPAAPLRMADEMRVTLETYDIERWKNCDNCGTNCTPDGSVRALRARVVVPPVEGGFSPDGYVAGMWISNDRPHELPDGQGGTLLNLSGGARLPVGQSTEILLSVPTEDRAYAPCFSLRVSDPAGRFVDAPALCLPPMDVDETIKQLDAKNADRSGGCALGNNSQTQNSAWFCLCVALALFRVGRRR